MKKISLFTMAPLAAAAIALTACGSSEIDHTKAENFIRQQAKAGGLTPITSLSCPSGITPKAGGTFDCQIALADGRKGTITLHMLDDKGKVQVGPSDLHVQ